MSEKEDNLKAQKEWKWLAEQVNQTKIKWKVGEEAGIMDKYIEAVERKAWDAARSKLPPVIVAMGEGVDVRIGPSGPYTFVNYDDWKKTQAFDATQDEAEHLERIKRELEK